MSRTATLVLFASVFASACAVPAASVDNVNADLRDALLAGDLDLALDIGHEFVGVPVDNGEPEGTPQLRPDGFIAASFTQNPDALSAADLVGAFTSFDGEVTREFAGQRLAPVDEQVQGEVYATSYEDAEEADGEVQGTFRASPSGAMGGVAGLWFSDSMQRPVEFRGVYSETAENEGLLFGAYRTLPLPVWTTQLRVRLFADGMSVLEITPDAISIHHIMGVAPGQTGTGGGKEAKATAINEQSWLPTWPEQGENLDCNCDSSTLFSGDDGLFSPVVAADVVLHQSVARGFVTVIEEPTADNGFLTRVLVNDVNFNGGAWYQVDLAFNK